MATLTEIQHALADQIRGVIDDVTDVAVQVEPRWVVNPSPPCIDMYVSDPTDQDLRAFGDLTGAEIITVRARVDYVDSDAQQDLLAALMDDEDPLSISAAIDEDDTLGGLASIDLLERGGLIRVVEGGDWLGCLWRVLVWKARS